MANEPLGERIARLRDERGMTQVALAREAGMSRGQLAAIESGRTTNPGVHTVVPLARALAVTLDELVGAPGSPAGPRLLDALNLLIERTAGLGRRPYDMFTPAEFERWALGTALTYSESMAAVEHLASHDIPAPVGAEASTAGAYFVTGAVAGAMLERWRT